MNVAVHFGVDPSGISGLPPGVPGVPDMPSGIIGTLGVDSEVDMELAGASISIEVKGLQSVGANLTFPSRDTSTFFLDGIYIRTSDLPMYPVR